MPEVYPVFPLDPLFCIPFNIGEGPSEAGPRIGGRSPAGVSRPTFNGVSLDYFLTLPLLRKPAKEFSIFIADFEHLINAEGELCEPGLVQVVIHDVGEREENTEFHAKLSEHPLILQERVIDWIITEKGEQIIPSFHKMGGRPYILRQNVALQQKIDNLFLNNYRQGIQIDFPVLKNDKGKVVGDWPFGDGIFHFFCPPDPLNNNWIWLWEM